MYYKSIYFRIFPDHHTSKPIDSITLDPDKFVIERLSLESPMEIMLNQGRINIFFPSSLGEQTPVVYTFESEKGHFTRLVLAQLVVDAYAYLNVDSTSDKRVKSLRYSRSAGYWKVIVADSEIAE